MQTLELEKLQYRVLFRESLFRMVDLELLSQQGDISKLLGQFAGLLVFASAVLGLGGLLFDTRKINPERLLTTIWGMEHFQIATTMLVVGLFAVLGWDSAFPNRRDVLVLAPLPVRSRTLFAAKAAALGASLGLTVAAFNGIMGLTWPVLVYSPAHSGLIGMVRTLAAYWLTMAAAGAFVFCGVLALQGVAAQLPRRYFLRLSAWLQVASFCLLICVRFLQPALARPQALNSAGNYAMLARLPSYWFFGLFQALSGTMAPAPGELAWLARRALAASAIAMVLAGTAFLLSYFRTMRKIVEEPDILPSRRGLRWTPPFGDALATAVVQFSIRTLLRSRQHRVILAFYLGLGFAFVVPLLNAPVPRWHTEVPMMADTIMMLCASVVGNRVVFAMPLELRANWIFRVTGDRAAAQCLAANRRALVLLAVAPVWLVSAALFAWKFPGRVAAGHMAVLAMLGIIVAEAALYGFQKLPFTCSYLPGKSRVHMAFLGAFGMVWVVVGFVDWERPMLEDSYHLAAALAILAIAAVAARQFTAARAKSDASAMLFEDLPEIVITRLDLEARG